MYMCMYIYIYIYVNTYMYMPKLNIFAHVYRTHIYTRAHVTSKRR